MPDPAKYTAQLVSAMPWLCPTEAELLAGLCESTAFTYHCDVFQYIASGVTASACSKAKFHVKWLQTAITEPGPGDWASELGLLTAGFIVHGTGSLATRATMRECLGLFVPPSLHLPAKLLSEPATLPAFLAWASMGCNVFRDMFVWLQRLALQGQLERAALAALAHDVALLCSSAVPAATRSVIARELLAHCTYFEALVTQLPDQAAECPEVQPFVDQVHAIALRVSEWGLDRTPCAFVMAKAVWTFSATLELSSQPNSQVGTLPMPAWAGLAMSHEPVPVQVSHEVFLKRPVLPVMDAPVAIKSPEPQPAKAKPATVKSAKAKATQAKATKAKATKAKPATASVGDVCRGLSWASKQISAGAVLSSLRAGAAAGALALTLQVCLKMCKGVSLPALLAMPTEEAIANALEHADVDIRVKRGKVGVSQARVIWRMVALREAAANAGIADLHLTKPHQLEAALATGSIMQSEWELFVEPQLANLNPPMLRAAQYAGLQLEQVHTLDRLQHMLDTLPCDTPAGIDAEWTPAVAGVHPPVGRLQVAVHRGGAWRGEQPLAELPCPPRHLDEVTVVVLDMTSLEREQHSSAGKAKLLDAILQLVRGSRPWVCAVEGTDDIDRVIGQLGGDPSSGSSHHVPVRTLCSDLKAAKDLLPAPVLARVGTKVGLSGMFDGFFHHQVFKFWQMCDQWSSGASLSPGALEYAALDAAAALELGCWIPAVGMS